MNDTYNLKMSVFIDENVLWLQISMHDLKLKALVETLDDASCVKSRHIGCQLA